MKKSPKNETGLGHCAGARRTVKSQVFSLYLYTLFCIWTEVHKVLVTQALPGTVCHLLDAVRGALKPGKLCKISEQKHFLSQRSKQSKNPYGPGLNTKLWLTQSRRK